MVLEDGKEEIETHAEEDSAIAMAGGGDASAIRRVILGKRKKRVTNDSGRNKVGSERCRVTCRTPSYCVEAIRLEESPRRVPAYRSVCTGTYKCSSPAIATSLPGLNALIVREMVV